MHACLLASRQANATIGRRHSVLANGRWEKPTQRKGRVGCLRRTRSGMHDFFRSKKSCSFYIKSYLVRCTERRPMIYLRGVRRDGGHEALHPKCYSGVRPRSRLRLSIIAKTSSRISTNCLRILHLTSWWWARRRIGREMASKVPYRGRCRLRFVVSYGCGDVDVTARSTSTAAATLGVW
jgi:hypothetical protein